MPLAVPPAAGLVAGSLQEWFCSPVPPAWWGDLRSGVRSHGFKSCLGHLRSRRCGWPQPAPPPLCKAGDVAPVGGQAPGSRGTVCAMGEPVCGACSRCSGKVGDRPRNVAVWDRRREKLR